MAVDNIYIYTFILVSSIGGLYLSDQQRQKTTTKCNFSDKPSSQEFYKLGIFKFLLLPRIQNDRNSKTKRIFDAL